jgi:hypothetical protein
VTSFGTTGGPAGPPDLPDGTAAFLYHPILPGGGDGGYQIAYAGVLPNGGGQYVNNYTFVFDLLVPVLRWTALFQTNPANPSGNDADWYIAANGSIGIAALGAYSDPGVIEAGRWHRVGFVRDSTSGTAKYWVDGNPAFTGSPGSLDGRFSLFSSNDAPPQVNLHGEGDTSGNYTNAMYMSSFLFADFAFDNARMAGLGGPSARGIPVPEPALAVLLLSAAGALGAIRRVRRA